jgi:hypothetical protein
MSDIQIVPALAACNQAMRQHPDVSRFVFQAGRVAQAQKDYALAPQLYEKAAGKNHAASYLNLGALCNQGNGAPKDFDAAQLVREGRRRQRCRGDECARLSLRAG